MRIIGHCPLKANVRVRVPCLFPLPLPMKDEKRTGGNFREAMRAHPQSPPFIKQRACIPPYRSMVKVGTAQHEYKHALKPQPQLRV